MAAGTNYDFCAEFAARHPRGPVLDYGCGAGQTVQMLLDRGIDAYGCDIFYEGGSYREVVSPELAEQERIREMPEGRIPFPDGFFDLVMHNQVFEHVPDLDLAVSEIARVLRPGGVMLGLWPHSSVWREGHCGVPFLHWFPKGSRLRTYYALAFRSLGVGYHHKQKTRMQWSREFCQWLDDWTYYRSRDELARVLTKHIGPPQHIEHELFDARKPGYGWLPRAIKTFGTRRWGGLAVWCQKAAAPAGAAAERAAPARHARLSG